MLALDLGSRRIGVAVSDAGRVMAMPRSALLRRDVERDRQSVIELVEEVGAGTVVVGLPRSLDGRLGPAAHAALAEAQSLREALEGSGVIVETVDERFTTVEATTRLSDAGKRGPAVRQSVDSAAAAVLLQAWLDSR